MNLRIRVQGLRLVKLPRIGKFISLTFTVSDCTVQLRLFRCLQSNIIWDRHFDFIKLPGINLLSICDPLCNRNLSLILCLACVCVCFWYNYDYSSDFRQSLEGNLLKCTRRVHRRRDLGLKWKTPLAGLLLCTKYHHLWEKFHALQILYMECE